MRVLNPQTLAFPAGHDVTKDTNRLQVAATTRGEHSEDFLTALATCERWGQAIKDAMDAHQLDALMVCETPLMGLMSAAARLATVS